MNYKWYSALHVIGFIVISFIMVLSIDVILNANSFAVSNIPNEKADKSLNKQHESFNVAVAGDYRCSNNANRTINGMLARPPKIVIALGDLSYHKSADCWFNIISPLELSSKFKITLGEHDLDDNLTNNNQYMKHFNLSKPYYSFDYDNVHFIAMATAKNSIIPYLKGSEQYNFVEKDLMNANKNNSIDWIVVFQFRPFYSSNTTHPGLDALQDTYHPLFDKYGVDLVLQAHNHNYQRTYPIMYNQSKTFTPIVTDLNTKNYYNPKGAIFATVGTGGEKMHNFTGQAPYVIKQFERHGYLDLTFTNNGSKMIGTFYENRALNDKDRFTITKTIKG